MPNNELRQGDWLRGINGLTLATSSGDRAELTPHGVAVVTQCCDLAQDHSGTVGVALVVELDRGTAADASGGRNTRYAHIADRYYADLAISTVISREFAESLRVESRMDTESRKLFASRISRRYSRFGYPEPMYEVLGPLRNKIRSKAPKDGAIGKVLRRVETMRLECEPGWDADGDVAITLLVLVDPEHLPSVDAYAQIDQVKYTETQSVDLTKSAEALLAVDSNDPAVVDLWQAFGAALLQLLRDGVASDSQDFVESVDVEVLRTDEFSYDRYLRSVDLDFDYLSPPTLG
ncbi:hypothetical protein FK535_00460 [Mycolicibacterium sp. 018/SC-01/001]|uniref:hypothetical protein n=1 Tax=Mycolicibacterium sp. 018/SC-01/001 TaxID=2592069 RepID=UPI00117C5A8E|nr:hypothetical protein [Mycolicibacterium sp. 018/SC-01/001]TRW88794.1 hypothetical protein FK535_00460 [Mycolicibacterium sp. 018/SC-01/001]